MYVAVPHWTSTLGLRVQVSHPTQSKPAKRPCQLNEANNPSKFSLSGIAPQELLLQPNTVANSWHPNTEGVCYLIFRLFDQHGNVTCCGVLSQIARRTRYATCATSCLVSSIGLYHFVCESMTPGRTWSTGVYEKTFG